MDIILSLAVVLVPLLGVLTVLASLGWLGLAVLASVGWVGTRLLHLMRWGGAERVTSHRVVRRASRCTSRPSRARMAFCRAFEEYPTTSRMKGTARCHPSGRSMPRSGLIPHISCISRTAPARSPHARALDGGSRYGRAVPCGPAISPEAGRGSAGNAADVSGARDGAPAAPTPRVTLCSNHLVAVWAVVPPPLVLSLTVPLTIDQSKCCQANTLYRRCCFLRYDGLLIQTP